MKRLFFISIIATFLTAAFCFSLAFENSANKPKVEQSSLLSAPENFADETAAQLGQKEKILAEYGKLPLHFEPNRGQTDERVKFVARGKGYGLFLTGDEAVLTLQKQEKGKTAAKSATVRMQIEGANRQANVVGINQTEGKSNYLIGNDAEKWQTEVPNFLKVKYESIYAGVDLVYYGNQRELEYDFVVQPNADPNQIKLNFDGVRDAKIDRETGDLLLKTAVGTIRQHAPVVYQEIDGARKEIAASYSIQNQKSKIQNLKVGFSLGDYDESKTLTIDPILVYSSYLGGDLFDEGRSIAVDAAGNAYVAGSTNSLDFPARAGTIKPVLVPRTGLNSYWHDAFVTKINADGTALVFSTYFGGRDSGESGTGVAVDAAGNVFLTGTTSFSAGIPTVNAYQATFGGTDDAFAAKLNPSGSALIYSTYIGGTSTETGSKIAVNAATGEAVFTGNASSTNFPTTPNAIKPAVTGSSSDGFVAKFAANGAAQFVTLFGGSLGESINDVALDASDNVYFVGQTNSTNFPATTGAFQTANSGNIEGFVGKINAAGTAVVYASYLGGGLQSDRAHGVAVDAGGNAYIVGQTENSGFPTTAGAFDQTFNGGSDAFLTKLNPLGSALVYSTFLGGTGNDKAFTVGVGENNNAFVAGETTSINFPLRNSLNVRKSSDGSTTTSIFVTRFNEAASAQIFSTILGVGGAYDIAIDGANSAYLTGHALNLTVTPNAFQTLKGGYPNLSTSSDGFVAKVGATDENAATFNISGNVSDQNGNSDYTPIIVSLSGTVNRAYMLPYGGGSGNSYYFGALPAGGSYTISARKLGYPTSPEAATFNNLQANQFADFTIQPNQKPVAVITSPEHGATFNAPANITITATATDADNHPITKVDFYAYSSEAGNILLGTDTTAPYEVTWTNAPAGTWSLNAIPTDSLGLRGNSTPIVHIEVFDATTPTVTLTSPANGSSYVQGDNILLSANVSSSINLLEFYEGANLIGRRTSAPWSATWRPMTTGTYDITAKGFTASGQTITSNQATVTVTPFNHVVAGRVSSSIDNSPVANITINLIGTNSISRTTTTNANGEYSFTNFGSTPDDSVTITPVSSNYTFNPAEKIISYLGYVNWNEVFTATPITGITVNLTSPTEGQIFVAPAIVNLSADASSTAGAIAKVEFLLRGTSGTFTVLETDTTAPYGFDWTGVPTGSYFLAARATDATNSVAQTPEVRIQVNQQSATVSISGQVVDAGGNGMRGIRLNLTGSQTQTALTNQTGYYGFYNLPAGGNHTITPQVVGTTGNSFTPAQQTFNNVTVNQLDANFTYSGFNQAPSVQFNSPTNGATFNMPTAIPINATATDSDGNIVHLSVTASNGTFTSTIGQSNNGTYSAPWQPNTPGNYTLTATARDNGGRQTSVQIAITVNQPAPVQIAGRIVDRDSQGIAGVTLTLKDYPEMLNTIATATTDASGNYALQNIPTFNNYILAAEKLNHTFSPQERIYFNLSADQIADFTATLALQRADFDGDSATDVSVFRPSTGAWHVVGSINNSNSILNVVAPNTNDVPVPGNYDGDQKIDAAVYRNGEWHIRKSLDGLIRTAQLGAATDKPVQGDFDGDGKTDIAVWRPSSGVWSVVRSSDGAAAESQWGLDGDKPLAGDYDGDGKTDLTVWRPSNGTWYIRRSSDGAERSIYLGAYGDTPLVGDFDGDKRADLIIYRPSNGTWYVQRAASNTYTEFQFGNAVNIPIPGDYDFDGKTDYAIYRLPVIRRSTKRGVPPKVTPGSWVIYRSSTNTIVEKQLGINGDVPVPSAYTR